MYRRNKPEFLKLNTILKLTIKRIMKKVNIILLIILSLLGLSFAEEYTIEKLLDLVKDCSDDIMVAELEYSAGQEEVKFYQSEAMPQVSFNTSVLAVARSIESMGFKAAAEMAGVDETHALGSSLSWTLSVRQPLFSFGRVIDALKIAQVRKVSLEDEIILKKNIYYLSVISHFTNVFLAQAAVDIAKKSENYYNKLLDRVKRDLLTGNGIKRDSLTLQALVYKTESELVLAQNQKKVALGRLAKLTEIALDQKDGSFRYDENGWASAIPEVPKEAKSVACKLKEHESAIMQYNADYEKSNLFPSINFISSVNNDLLIPWDSTIRHFNPPIIPISTHYDYFKPQYWNYAVGIQISWNIFDGRRSLAKANQARINFEKTDRALKIFREENEEEIKEASDALEVIEQSKKAVLLQIKAVNTALKQINLDYTAGFVEYATILDLERQLREAENSLNQLYMQRLLAVAQLKIASGLTLIKE